MGYTNRKFNWDLKELNRFYYTWVLKWINSALNWTNAQKQQARANLGFGNGSIDATPTQNSDNMVKSGGVWSAINAVKQWVSDIFYHYKPLIINGNITNRPDEEDLTQTNTYALKLKDRTYSPDDFSSMGRVILRKNIHPLDVDYAFDGFVSDVETSDDLLEQDPNAIYYDTVKKIFVAEKDGINYRSWGNMQANPYAPIQSNCVYMCNGKPYRWNGSDLAISSADVATLKNLLTQDMFCKDGPNNTRVPNTNTIFVIQYDFTLGENITIPANCVLQFDGGSISGDGYNLIGEVVTTKGYLGLSEIGIKYDDSASALTNVERFSVLAGITNDIVLYLSNDVYFAGACSKYLNNLHIEGNGHTISLGEPANDGSYITNPTFNVKGDVIINNVHIIGTDTKFAAFVYLQDSANPAKVRITNSYFSGNLRVMRSFKSATSGTNDNLTEFTVNNCTFENIWTKHDYNSPSDHSLVFQNGNMNVLKANISNNTIHNFIGGIFEFGTPNGNVVATYMHEYYINKGREFIFENNTVFNDIDFKPWINHADVDVYYTSPLLVEEGDVIIRNNLFKNIIDNRADVYLYPCYCQTYNYTFENNVVENCVNIKGSESEAYFENTLFVCKSSGGKRNVVSNIFKLEDITSDVGASTADLEASAPILLEMTGSATWDSFTMRDNRFDLYCLRTQPSPDNKIKNIFIDNNTFIINKTTRKSAAYDCGIVFVPNDTNPYLSVTNNHVKVTAADSNTSFISDTENASYTQEAEINVCGNHVEGIQLIRLFSKKQDSAYRGIVSNNVLVDCPSLLYAYYPYNLDALTLEGNKLIYNTITAPKVNIGKGIVKKQKFGFVSNNSALLYAFDLSSLNTGVYALCAKVTFDDGSVGYTQVNIDKVNNKIYATTNGSTISEATGTNHINATYFPLKGENPRFWARFTSINGIFFYKNETNYYLNGASATCEVEIEISEITDTAYFFNCLPYIKGGRAIPTALMSDKTIGFTYCDNYQNVFGIWNGSEWKYFNFIQ